MEENGNQKASRQLDEQEKLISRCLIRDPRMSDTRLAKETGIPMKTAKRKRIRLEQENLLSYFAYLDLQSTGAGLFNARHLYQIKFKLGVTRKQILDEIRQEPNVKTIFTELIYESHLAEIDGHIALVLLVEGQTDAEIVENVQSKIIPSLMKNHGQDSIMDISSIRLLMPIRIMHNYLPCLNMQNGRLREDAGRDTIFVG
ncbi:MAG: hypothetical protein HYU36_23920 [Planctomycetes bacterium]|nr:hypothetical protein [Planctomycetota bacterium]